MNIVAMWCLRHRRAVVALWALALFVLVGAAAAIGPVYDNTLALPGTESAKAQALLRSSAPKAAGDVETIVVGARDGRRVTDAASRRAVETTLVRLKALPGVSDIRSPYAAGSEMQISRDATVAFATVTFSTTDDKISVGRARDFVDAAKVGTNDGLVVAVEGPLATKAAEPSLGGVAFGVLAAALVLVVVFGSLLAATLPLITTMVAMPAALSVVTLLTHVVGIGDFAGEIVLLLGLGVGVDYALFIVTRTRQALLEGHDPDSAVLLAVATAGRAVLFAGAIVCIALLGLLAMGVGLLSGLGIAASVGVLCVVATSLTLLPALLGFLGLRVLSKRQRAQLASGSQHREASTTGLWQRWSAVIARRPVVAATASLLVIFTLCVPAFSMRLGFADAGNANPGTTTRVAYDLLAQGFGEGFNGPLVIAVRRDSGDDASVSLLRRAIARDRGVAGVGNAVRVGEDARSRVTTFEVYPKTSPQSIETTRLVQRLRHTVIPAAVAGSSVRAYVGGTTATSIDFAHVMSSKMPLFVALVVSLSCLLLMLLFRSIVIPLLTAAVNFLSIGAAFGVLSAAYVWGWGGELLLATRAGPIEAPLPVVVFAILFGLSMDYQMFFLSRAHEEWQLSGDNTSAVTRALTHTGRTITAAGLIMIAVFGSFIFGGDRLIMMFGLGLAVAVLLDAFVIRVAVVPALMLLIGARNWWLPEALARILPRVHGEAVTPVSSRPAFTTVDG